MEALRKSLGAVASAKKKPRRASLSLHENVVRPEGSTVRAPRHRTSWGLGASGVTRAATIRIMGAGIWAALAVATVVGVAILRRLRRPTNDGQSSDLARLGSVSEGWLSNE